MKEVYDAVTFIGRLLAGSWLPGGSSVPSFPFRPTC